MEKWVCELCGYVYDPERGGGDAPPGTPFGNLPDDWECPECLASKERFIPESQASLLKRMPHS
ncbi:rubredoxin [Desulfocucumis palustris]|uniref:Rubredoxin n=1 Tax=Desulfocucumis palustris TaxID=1898651 RepID=A0A2L2XNZ8_9FIRM|nr:rubredoxin [Desulfocucumis palustris]GBF35701.1 rubredoxin [Desulfocucumis palustris]